MQATRLENRGIRSWLWLGLCGDVVRSAEPILFHPYVRDHYRLRPAYRLLLMGWVGLGFFQSLHSRG